MNSSTKSFERSASSLLYCNRGQIAYFFHGRARCGTSALSLLGFGIGSPGSMRFFKCQTNWRHPNFVAGQGTSNSSNQSKPRGNSARTKGTEKSQCRNVADAYRIRRTDHLPFYRRATSEGGEIDCRNPGTARTIGIASTGATTCVGCRAVSDVGERGKRCPNNFPTKFACNPMVNRGLSQKAKLQ